MGRTPGRLSAWLFSGSPWIGFLSGCHPRLNTVDSVGRHAHSPKAQGLYRSWQNSVVLAESGTCDVQISSPMILLKKNKSHRCKLGVLSGLLTLVPEFGPTLGCVICAYLSLLLDNQLFWSLGCFYLFLYPFLPQSLLECFMHGHVSIIREIKRQKNFEIGILYG